MSALEVGRAERHDRKTTPDEPLVVHLTSPPWRTRWARWARARRRITRRRAVLAVALALTAGALTAASAYALAHRGDEAGAPALAPEAATVEVVAALP